MKRFFALAATLLLLFSICGCSYKVNNPLPYPNYLFEEAPDTTQLRETAVQAMRDLLSVEWCSADGLAYYKNGSKKHFQYPKDMTFGGVMYTGASAGLFHFLEFYNHETGKLEYPGTADELKMQIGSACADSLLWSWATVTNSTSGGFYPSTMVQKNGFIPVGEYTYSESLNSFYNLSTEAIIANNGTTTMAASYAAVLPADALVSSTDDHAIMAIEAPTVVYRDNGNIDLDESYIVIQDQRGGVGAGFYEVEHDGYTVHHSGRISHTFTFKELMEKNYIPVTTAEFIGEKPYDAPTVTVEGGEAATVQDLEGLTLVSNYPIAVININGADDKGNVTNVEKIFLGGASEHGAAKTYALKDAKLLSKLEDGKFVTAEIEVVSSTGKRFFPISLSLS